MDTNFAKSHIFFFENFIPDFYKIFFEIKIFKKNLFFTNIYKLKISFLKQKI